MQLSRLLTISLLFLSLSLLSNEKTYAQVPVDTTGKILEIIKAARYHGQKIEGVGDFISLAGDVRIKQGKTLFFCDSAVLNQTANVIEAFGNIHINDADSVHTYSQYLKYRGFDKIAVLKNKVRLTDGRATLTTSELEYNTLSHMGTYLKGGKVVNNKTVLTSKEGYYYGETRDIYFKKKVVLIDPEYKVTTDTLLYNTYTEIARFVVPTKITTDQRTVTTSEGYYDLRNKKAFFGKRPVVSDKDYTITADEMAFDDSSHFSEARGSVVYKTKDTANAMAILSNNMKSNTLTGAVLATQKPLMIIKQNQDSIYISADTLYTAKLTDLRKTRYVPDILTLTTIKDTLKKDTLIKDTAVINTTLKPSVAKTVLVKDTTTKVSTGRAKAAKVPAKKAAADSNSNRFIEAYYNVKIFSDSLQAVGDSMFYSLQDSAFRLFKNPVVWAQDNQITGDTIYLFTANKKPKRFYVFENAIAINKVETDFYNQVKGTVINGYFENGNINYFNAKGNAENIYYAADEAGGYIGVNRATSDVIDVYFENRKPHKVVLRNNLQGTISPMRQVNHTDLRLRGFKWQEDRRPKTRFDLIAD